MTTQGTINNSIQTFQNLFQDEKWDELEKKQKEFEYMKNTTLSTIEWKKEINGFNTRLISFSQPMDEQINRELVISNYIGEMFYFHHTAINLMNKNTIHAIIEDRLKVMEQDFISYKKSFFSKTEMMEEEYEEQKLVYLVTHQEEPTKVYSKEEFAYICGKFVEMMRKLSWLYFELKGSTLPNQDVLNYTLEFYSEMLTRFDSVHQSVSKKLYDSVLKKVKERKINEQDIFTYRRYKSCLISDNLSLLVNDYLKQEATAKENSENLHLVNLDRKIGRVMPTLQFTMRNWDTIIQLVTPENAANIINLLTSYIDSLLKVSALAKGENIVRIYNFILESKEFISKLDNNAHGES